MRWIRRLDWLGRTRIMDYHDEAARREVAPNLPFDDLDKVIHMKLPNGQFMTGFDGFRALAWHLPPTWIIAPFLYLPGVSQIGRAVYAQVSARRKKCTHEDCNV